MTQLMTRGCNLQLPNCQVILLISASGMQGKGAFKAFGHMAGIQSYMIISYFFFFAHTVKPELFTVHQNASGLYCCQPTDFFKITIDIIYFTIVNFSFLTLVTEK